MEGNIEEHRSGQAASSRVLNREQCQENHAEEYEEGEAEEDNSPVSSRRPTQELSRKISLPVLPTPTVGTSFSMDTILGAIKDEDSDDLPDFSKKQDQRMSRVLKLKEENEKLEAELKALRERIAAAEEKSQTLTQTGASSGNAFTSSQY